jgi:sugar phosphate isomerase/epimerase
MAKIGLQLYTLHDMAKADLLGTLGEVARLGFEGVEFAGYFDVPPRTMKARLDDLGLAAMGSHLGYGMLKDHFQETVEEAKAIGLATISCMGLPAELHKDRVSWATAAGLLNDMGKRCREAGLRCGYQNHDFEFQNLGSETALDVLMAGTEPANVFLELDIFWAEYCGHPADGLIRDLKGRCRYLHVTDMKRRGEKQNTELGAGVLDLPAMVRAGQAAGVEWYIVKHIGFEKPALESLAVSLGRLRGIIAGAGKGGKA